jgi:cytidylate kinase
LVVCISEETGAEGETVGRLVAQRLGLRYVDEEIVARAADRGGVEIQAVASAEEKRSRLTRVLELLSDVGPASGILVGEPTPVRTARDERHRELIRDVVEQVAGEGNAVIVAHAASIAVAGHAGTLRVLVTASPEVRARRLAESEGEDRAVKLVRENDAARASYLKRFYDVDRELPTHYDLVVNTDVLEPEQAAEIVAHAARLAAAG